MKLHDFLKAFPAILGIVIAVSVGCDRAGQPGDHDGHDHSTNGQGTHASAAAESNAVMCAAHDVPEELCFICNAGLREEGRLWCRGHGRYEDRCWECHPELCDAERLYCEEHGLYEDECHLCEPGLQPASTGQAGNHAHGLMCDAHGVAEAECGICRPDVIGSLKPGEGLKVRMPSLDSAKGAGAEIGRASVGSITEAIESYAELAFDQNKVAQIVAPVGGIVEEVSVDLGTQVVQNQVVARLWSAGIAEAVAKAVLSHQTLDRERRLREQRVTSEQDLQEAEAVHRAACQQLRTFGFTEEQIHELGETPDESVLLDVRAPFAGEIIEREAVRGELVETGHRLFTLGDRSVMWAMLNIPESDLGRVRKGQTVELQFDSIPGTTFRGELTWISAQVDERSRMVRARAEVPNPEGLLRARMFTRARILTRSSDEVLLLPASAIQQVEGHALVFVQLEEDLFEARRVELGARMDSRVEVLDGLSVEEVVVVDHVFPIKSQLLLSRLGAGCAHE